MALPAIVDFLDEEPEFVFHLDEYVESTLHLREATAAHEHFMAWARLRHPFSWSSARTMAAELESGVDALRDLRWDDPTSGPAEVIWSREDLRRTPERFRNQALPPKKSWHRETSGSSGRPVVIHYAPATFFRLQYFGTLEVAAVRGVNLDPIRRAKVLCLTLHDRQGLQHRVWVPPDDSLGLTIRRIIDHDETSVTRVIELLLRHRPAILSLRPDLLALLLRSPNDRLAQALGAVFLVISGGAVLETELRDEFESRFTVPLSDCYGMSEVLTISSTCAESQHHVHTNDLIVEVLDEQGRICDEGVGELIVTRLTNAAQPLVRYLTGDRARLSAATCRCGQSGATLAELSGRKPIEFALPSGRRIPATRCDSLFDLFPVKEFRVTQLGASDFLLQLHSGTTHAGLLSAELPQIGNALAALLGEQVRIEVEQATLESGKHVRYASLLQTS